MFSSSEWAIIPKDRESIIPVMVHAQQMYQRMVANLCNIKQIIYPLHKRVVRIQCLERCLTHSRLLVNRRHHNCSFSYYHCHQFFHDYHLCCVLYCSVVSDSFATPWTIACQAPLSMGFPRPEYWSGLPFLLQWIFPT